MTALAACSPLHRAYHDCLHRGANLYALEGIMFRRNARRDALAIDIAATVLKRYSFRTDQLPPLLRTAGLVAKLGRVNLDPHLLPVLPRLNPGEQPQLPGDNELRAKLLVAVERHADSRDKLDLLVTVTELMAREIPLDNIFGMLTDAFCRFGVQVRDTPPVLAIAAMRAALTPSQPTAA